MELASRTFLITGAASGLGAATARRFHAGGARVALADLNDAAIAALAGELQSGATACPMDVTQADSVQRGVDQAVRTFGALHGVVHCAGILGAARLVGRDGPHPLDEFRRIIEVNLLGTFHVLRSAAAAMAQTPIDPADSDGERGVLITTASVAAFEGQIGQCAYSAAKGGVAAMTLPAARELARFGIRVVAIAPGVFETPMIQRDLNEPRRQALVGQAVFPRRLGKPEEFAALAQQVVENRMLNGCVVRLDGAVRLPAK